MIQNTFVNDYALSSAIGCQPDSSTDKILQVLLASVQIRLNYHVPHLRTKVCPEANRFT